VHANWHFICEEIVLQTTQLKSSTYTKFYVLPGIYIVSNSSILKVGTYTQLQHLEGGKVREGEMSYTYNKRNVEKTF